MYSPRGGMNIEQVAEETPDEIFTEIIDPKVGLTGFQARRIAFNLGLSGTSFKEMVKFVAALYKAYVGSDASLFEINPVIKAADGRIYAADQKFQSITMRYTVIRIFMPCAIFQRKIQRKWKPAVST